MNASRRLTACAGRLFSTAGRSSELTYYELGLAYFSGNERFSEAEEDEADALE